MFSGTLGGRHLRDFHVTSPELMICQGHCSLVSRDSYRLACLPERRTSWRCSLRKPKPSAAPKETCSKQLLEIYVAIFKTWNACNIPHLLLVRGLDILQDIVSICRRSLQPSNTPSPPPRHFGSIPLRFPGVCQQLVSCHEV